MGGWAVGAVISTVYTAWMIKRFQARGSLAITMATIAVSWFIVPFSPVVVVAVFLYAVGGSARGVCGVALSTTLMENVPKHLMGRVQNTIYFAGTLMQVSVGMLVGVVAHRIGLAEAFFIVGAMYFCGFIAAMVPAQEPSVERADATVA